MMKSRIFMIASFAITLLLQACELDNVYNEYFDFPAYVWTSDNSLVFEIDLENVTSERLNVNYDLRYVMQYPYRNLFIAYVLKDSTGKIKDEGMQNLILFEDKTGRPKGDGLGDIFDYEFQAFRNIDLSKGRYTLEINQFMRDQDLPYMMSFGVRIEESTGETVN